MELEKNLLKKVEKNPLFVFLGIMFLVIAILWLLSKRWNNESVKIFDCIYSGIFALNALIHMMRGFGYPIEGFIGKAFIKIDSNRIQMKSGIFKKEQIAIWDLVQSIDCKANQLVIRKNDNSCILFPFSEIEYSTVQELKNILTAIASKKGIVYNSLI